MSYRQYFCQHYRGSIKSVHRVKHLAAEGLVVDEGFPLARSERMELLINRCFIRTPKPSNDLWPYYDRLVCVDSEAVSSDNGFFKV